MYLAGLIDDGSKITKKELETWASQAEWPMINEYSVAWVAYENEAGWERGLQWIDSPKTNVATSGWPTLSGIFSTWPDEKLDMVAIKKLILRVQKEMAAAPNRVRYCMNGFDICAGSFFKRPYQRSNTYRYENG